MCLEIFRCCRRGNLLRLISFLEGKELCNFVNLCGFFNYLLKFEIFGFVSFDDLKK